MNIPCTWIDKSCTIFFSSQFILLFSSWTRVVFSSLPTWFNAEVAWVLERFCKIWLLRTSLPLYRSNGSIFSLHVRNPPWKFCSNYKTISARLHWNVFPCRPQNYQFQKLQILLFNFPIRLVHQWMNEFGLRSFAGIRENFAASTLLEHPTSLSLSF